MGKLTFWYSCVNAGKSTQLLQMNHAYVSRGLNTMLYTSALDSRSGSGIIRSRLGVEAIAVPLEKEDNVFNHFCKCTDTKSYAAVFVDEAQFLTRSQIYQLTKIADKKGVDVHAFGLRTDFKGDPFEASVALLALSDELKEVITVDSFGDKATMSAKVSADGSIETQGDTLSPGYNYKPVSRKTFFELTKLV